MEKKIKPGPKPIPSEEKKVTKHYCVKRKFEKKAAELVDEIITAINEGHGVKIQIATRLQK